MESGEYFLTSSQKAARAEQDKQERQQEATVEKKRKREEAFVPPKAHPWTRCLCLYDDSIAAAGRVFTLCCTAEKENSTS